MVEFAVVDVGVCYARHEDATSSQSSVVGETGLLHSQGCPVHHVNGTPLGACSAGHDIASGMGLTANTCNEDSKAQVVVQLAASRM